MFEKIGLISIYKVLTKKNPQEKLLYFGANDS
jgi:hypothetical protein